jgi:hypothetical protein
MEWDELKHRPVFIAGHPKSGTSLLLNLLDSHPQLVVFPEETVFFRRVLRLLAQTSPDRWFEIAVKHLIHFFQWDSQNPVPGQTGFESHDYSDVSYQQVHSELMDIWDQVEVEADVLGAAALAFGTVSGQLGEETAWWVEKTPLNEYYADEIFVRWPEARMLHIVRDPRDNYSSYERKHADWTAQHFARKWRRSTRAGSINQQKYGITRYLMVNYEDLVINTRQKIEQISDFLGIKLTENLLQPTKVGRGWKANTMFDEVFEQVSSSPVGRWRSILSDFDVGVIETIASKQMKAQGYPLAGRGGLRAFAYGLYWRLRQNYYFSLGAGRNQKGFR